MITARTCGRLGNFLFQFAATYCHAKWNGFDYCMPKRSMNERLWPTPKFKNIKYCGPQPGRLYQEPSPEYSTIPNEDNIILEGYYQSERYWHGFHDDIAEILEFERGEGDYVAVHVRRGDYLKFPNEFPVLAMDYYRSAIDLMAGIGHKKFRIYSDDIKWCMIAFGIHNFPDIEIGFLTGGHPLDDMRDIYQAKSMIIANSTFSLFPALLRSDNPLVIAPAEHRWFGKNAQHLNSPDRMPERFIKM